MTDESLIQALNRLVVVEDPAYRCLGCGHEHNCSIHGCQIISSAVKRLKELCPNRTPKQSEEEALANKLREIASQHKRKNDIPQILNMAADRLEDMIELMEEVMTELIDRKSLHVNDLPFTQGQCQTVQDWLDMQPTVKSEGLFDC